MTLRADHVSGAAFVAFGLLVIALSGDLPFGDLAMPGAGFMPILIAVLMIVFGIALMMRAGESAPFGSINWSDGKHAVLVMAITAVSVALYERLGFAITMLLMMMGFLIIIERRNPVRAAIFSISVAAITLGLFAYALQTPLAEGPFGF
jgi:tripartite tricarboxylate transporter TctB family protein